jgi:hypothetical protein
MEQGDGSDEDCGSKRIKTAAHQASIKIDWFFEDKTGDIGCELAVRGPE